MESVFSLPARKLGGDEAQGFNWVGMKLGGSTPASPAAGTPGRNPGGTLQVAGLSSVLTEPGHRGRSYSVWVTAEG